MLRTHTCGELRIDDKDKEVILAGWVQSRRDHGGVIFLDLRDRYGVTQVTVAPESPAFKVADKARSEFVLEIKGNVTARPKEMMNKELGTGEVELEAVEAKILAESKTLPFELSKHRDVGEDVRLKYRYLDLRRETIRDNIIFRHKMIQQVRSFLTEEAFLEIHTPLLTASSPEGARDFLVPSRLHPGKFYALPQAPQQFKQLLMVAGMDRYFQIAPALRDEDPRADRAPGEFYQIDMEMSFVEEEDIFDVAERMFIHVTEALTEKKIWKAPFPRITFEDAMNKWGSDRPDLRFGLEFTDVTSILKESEAKIFSEVEMGKALVAPKTFSRKELDDLTDLAKTHHAGGLGWFRIKEGGEVDSPLAKFFEEASLARLVEKTGAKAGETILLIGDTKDVSRKALGEIRHELGRQLELADPNMLAYAWIVDFPYFEETDDGGLDFMHNPFSAPVGGLKALEEEEPLNIISRQYDIICNGLELSSGAIRNTDPEALIKGFEIIGRKKSWIEENFGHMLEAFSFGVPPHGGLAPGLERWLMVLLDEKAVREVVPFPKNQTASDPMMGAPSEVDPQALKDLNIKLDKPKK